MIRVIRSVKPVFTANVSERAMFLRRLILVPTALILAITVGFIFLLIGGLAEPAGRKVLEGIGWIFLLAVRADALQGEPAGSYLALAAKIIWGATLAIVVAPVLLTALIGEAARLRSFIWYVAAPAVLTAMIPWLARAARAAGSSAIRDAATRSAGTQADEARLALLLFLSGALSGFIYWAVAGRDAGVRRVVEVPLETPQSPKP
ncbi:MAG: hypothetical protein JOY97_00335 [Hyphomicrobiales bacterium]|nr:hypothetical protein [Hyphomicrobiales bacterium]